MTAQLQLSFTDLAQGRLCDYGTPALGEQRPCNRPATHAAVCHQRAYRCAPDTCGHSGPAMERDEHVARIECCRDHANYYASAWAAGGITYYPQACRSMAESTWIETLTDNPRSTT